MQTQSLKWKIYSGFAVISVLLILIALVSTFSLRQLGDGRDAIRSVEASNASALRVDRDLQDLRARVDRYVSAGSDAQLDAIRDTHRRVIVQLNRAASQTDDADMRLSFEQIGTHVDRYASLIDSIAQERHLRRSLVRQVLPALAHALDRDLAQLAADATDAAGSLAIAQLQSSVIRAERAITQYFTNPGTGAVDEAIEHLHKARNQATGLTDGAALQAQILSNLDEFERSSLRAVQATRSYLFFVNVVMAGEASEVGYYAGRLRDVAARRRAEISRKAMLTSTNTSRLTAVIVIVAIGLSLFIAARLALIIVPPIMRLTGAFEQLAAGRTEVNLPDTPRGDEIGRMARAAHSFSDQNQKTKDLLHDSERLRRELEINATKLEATNKELDEFAYVASHDLKSPLRGIRQLAMWITEDSGDRLPQDAAEHLERMVVRVNKMETLLEDLLNYSRAGRIEPEAEYADVSEIVKTALELTDNPFNIAVQLPDNAPRICVVKPPLEQVLRNLIGNAVHHNDKGRDGRVEVSCWTAGDWCHFKIYDNGPGIDPSNHRRAFQMYQRVGKGSVSGSGMGLAIIKKQVESRGGRITLTSTLGNGATFEFTWPMTTNGAMNEQRKAS